MGVSYHGGFGSQVRKETLKCLVIINIYSFISWFPPPPIFCPFKKSGCLNDSDGGNVMMMMVMFCQCSLYDLQTSLFSLYMYFRYFLPVCGLCFCFIIGVSLKKEVLNIYKIQI